MLSIGSGLRECYNCGDCEPLHKMCPWSKSWMSCHTCKTNYNRQTERVAHNIPLRKWWKSHTPEDRKSWFQRNKATFEHGKRKEFDNAGFDEFEKKAKQRLNHDVVGWMTDEDWIIRQRLLGKEDLKYEEWMERFKEKVLGPSSRAKKAENGAWLLPVYRGQEDKVGTM